MSESRNDHGPETSRATDAMPSADWLRATCGAVEVLDRAAPPEGSRYPRVRMSDDREHELSPSVRAQVAQLYARHSESLLAFFRASLPIAKDDAVDLLQQTFVEVLNWHKNGPGRNIAHPRAFLYTIANRRLSAYRDKQRRTPDEPQGVEPELDSQAHQDDLEYLATLHDGQRGVLRAMRRLQQREWQVMLYLRFWEGLSEEGVARVLERPRATVAGQLRRARTAVKAKLDALGEREPDLARTSTTLLERWWQQVEAEAHGLGPKGDGDD